MLIERSLLLCIVMACRNLLFLKIFFKHFKLSYVGYKNRSQFAPLYYQGFKNSPSCFDCWNACSYPLAILLVSSWSSIIQIVLIIPAFPQVVGLLLMLEIKGFLLKLQRLTGIPSSSPSKVPSVIFLIVETGSLRLVNFFKHIFKCIVCCTRSLLF